MTIGEPAGATGVPASPIRYCERIGVLPKPRRGGNQRRYDSDVLHRISVRRLAQDCGFRLPEMRHLFHGFSAEIPASERWQPLARRKQLELDNHVERLRPMRQRWEQGQQCRCLELVDCGPLVHGVLDANTQARRETERNRALK